MPTRGCIRHISFKIKAASEGHRRACRGQTSFRVLGSLFPCCFFFSLAGRGKHLGCSSEPITLTGGSFNLGSNNHLANWVYNRAQLSPFFFFFYYVHKRGGGGDGEMGRSRSARFHGQHQKHMRIHHRGEEEEGVCVGGGLPSDG